MQQQWLHAPKLKTIGALTAVAGARQPQSPSRPSGLRTCKNTTPTEMQHRFAVRTLHGPRARGESAAPSTERWRG